MNEARRATDRRRGRLFIIGGGEDRENDKKILARLVDLAGGERSRIVVVTAASAEPRAMWEMYDRAFGELGLERREHIPIASREEANDERRAEQIMAADAVFMTGGDQRRLLAIIGGTLIDKAMHRAFQRNGACIAGTSAGASAMSEHMLASGGGGDGPPAKDDTHLAAGLGFLQRVVVDQHFSERRRLTRLLGIVAQNPYLLGLGIDEDTAVVVDSGLGLEVLGNGGVTVIDGRHMTSNFLDAEEGQRMELLNVKLHLLPGGARYALDDPGKIPESLRDVVAALTTVATPPLPSFPASAERRRRQDRGS